MLTVENNPMGAICLTLIARQTIDGLSDEEILANISSAVACFEEIEKKKVTPEALLEMGKRFCDIWGISEYNRADEKRILGVASEYWKGYWEDAFEETKSSMLDQGERVRENSIDASTLEHGLITDKDIYELCNGNQGKISSVRMFDEKGVRPDPDGIYSERIFGPMHGMTCQCGACNGFGEIPAMVGSECPNCHTLVRSSSSRKTTWGYVESPLPLVYGREELIGSMAFNLMPDSVRTAIEEWDTSKRIVLPKDVILSMANSESNWCWFEDKETGKGQILGIKEASLILKGNNGRYKALAGPRGIEEMLRHMDTLGSLYKKGDSRSALASAYDYFYLLSQLYKNSNVKAGDEGKTDAIELQMAAASSMYRVAYSFLLGQGNKPSEALLHLIPVCPPGDRPLNDRNGKSDLGDINEALLEMIATINSTKNIYTELGNQGLVSSIRQEKSKEINEAVDKYLSANYDRIFGKTGIVRGRLYTQKSKEMVNAVIVPDDQQDIMDKYFDGKANILGQNIVGLPRVELRHMYEKEIRALMKANKMTKEEIAAALLIPAGTMEKDENGKTKRCLADLALEAVTKGYTGKGKDWRSPWGKMYVEEDNPFGMSKKEAETSYKNLEDLEASFGQNFPVVALSRDPVISSTSIQFASIYPCDGYAIKINPLLMKGFAGDFDGDRIAAIKVKALYKDVEKYMYDAMYKDNRKLQRDGSLKAERIQAPALESLIALNRFTRSSEVPYSFKYDCILTNVNELKESGALVEEGEVYKIAKKNTSLIGHRILRELDDVNLSVTIGEHIAPGQIYAQDKDGNCLKAEIIDREENTRIGIGAKVIETSKGKFLVDAYPDKIQAPLGGTISKENDYIYDANERIVTSKTYKGNYEVLEKAVLDGIIPPTSPAIVDDKLSTAGRHIFEHNFERYCALEQSEHGFEIPETGITAKWINEQISTEGIERLSAFGYRFASSTMGNGMSVWDFPEVAPLDTSLLTGKTEEEKGEEYKEKAKKVGTVLYKYLQSYNSGYLETLVGSGVKGVGLVEALANNSLEKDYEGVSLFPSGGNVVTGNFGYRGEIERIASVRSNNKTDGVGEVGAIRNELDENMQSAFVEKGDCGNKGYVIGGKLIKTPLTCSCKGTCSECLKSSIQSESETKELAKGCEIGANIGLAAVAALIEPISQGIMDIAKKSQAANANEVQTTPIDDLSNMFSGRTPRKLLEGCTDVLEGAKKVVDAIRQLAPEDFPEEYAEIIAKQYIFVIPDNSSVQDEIAPEKTIFSLSEWIGRGESSGKIVFASKPGLYDDASRRDAVIDTANKTRGGKLAILNASKGTIEKNIERNEEKTASPVVEKVEQKSKQVERV